MAISKAELDRLCDRPYHDLDQEGRAAVLERCNKTCGDTLFPLLTQHLAKHPSDTARRAMIQILGHEPGWPKSHPVRRRAKAEETVKAAERSDPSPAPVVGPEPDPGDSDGRPFTPTDPCERIMAVLDDLHREARATADRAWDEADTDLLDLANAADGCAISAKLRLARRMGEAL